MLTDAKVAGAFARRYESALSAPSFPGPHGQHLIDLTRLLNACPDPKAAGKAALDAFFADDGARERGFAVSELVKRFGLYLERGRANTGTNERAESARERYEVAKARSGASRADCDLTIPAVAAIFEGK